MNAQAKSIDVMEEDARAIFQAAVAAVDPEECVSAACGRAGDRLTIGDHIYRLNAFDRIYVVGAGKASAPMGAAMERLLHDDLTRGVIVVKYGHTRPLSKIKQIEAGHPLPDENGEKGAGEIFRLVRQATERDLIIGLFSGGGSALLPLPAPGISLADKQETMRLLLACGASIHEINTLRKHVSAIKGGRLAKAAFPATMVSLLISDVVGNDPAVIASGPTAPDPGTYRDCQWMIERYGIANRLPESVRRHIDSGAAGRLAETPKPGDAVLARARNLICADNMKAILAARDRARQLGYEPVILSTLIEGETLEIARMHAAIAREVRLSGNPVRPPACILSGGETTVTLRGSGRGGRNQEFCLAVAGDIAETDGIVMLSGGTDGTDGPTDAAGAVIHRDLLRRATALGLDPRAYLDNNDAYAFFRQTGGLLITGPTGTNVMDIRIMLIA
ncbi:MAG: glycerate kinase [Thermodesulfobacteriota bacterium]